MKKNREFYEAVFKEIRGKFESTLPNRRYAYEFVHSTGNVKDYVKNYFAEKDLYDLIPNWSNKEVDNGYKLKHVFHFIRIGLCAICVRNVWNSGSYLAEILEETFRVNEYKHLFHPFIPKMERMTQRINNLSFTLHQEAKERIKSLKNKVEKSKRECDEVSSSYEITEEDKIVKSISYDALFKESLLFLDVFELLELTLVSKSFCENIWKYSLGNRNLKSVELFHFLFNNGREVSDTLLLKMLKHRVIDTNEFIKGYLHPHCFRRRYLKSLSYIVSTHPDYDFPFKKLYTQSDGLLKHYGPMRVEIIEYFKVIDYRHNYLCSILTCLQATPSSLEHFKLPENRGVEIFEKFLRILFCFRFDTILSKNTPLEDYIEFVFTIIQICGISDDQFLNEISTKKYMKNHLSILIIEPVFRLILERNKENLEVEFLQELCKKITEMYNTIDYSCDFSKFTPTILCDTIFQVCKIDPSFEDHYLLLLSCKKLDYHLMKALIQYEEINPSYNNNEPFFTALTAKVDMSTISSKEFIPYLAKKIEKLEIKDQRWEDLLGKCFKLKKFRLVDFLLQTEGLSDHLEVSERMIMDSFNEIRWYDKMPAEDHRESRIGMFLALTNAKKIITKEGKPMDKNVLLDFACERGMDNVVKLLVHECGIDPTNRGTNSPLKTIIQNDYKQRFPGETLNMDDKDDECCHYWRCLKILLDTGKVDPSIEDNYCIRHSHNVCVIKILQTDERVDITSGNYEIVLNSLDKFHHFSLFKYLLEHEKISHVINNSEEFRDRIFQKLLEISRREEQQSSETLQRHFEYLIFDRKFEQKGMEMDVISGLIRSSKKVEIFHSKLMKQCFQKDDDNRMLLHIFTECYHLGWKEGVWELLRNEKKRLSSDEKFMKELFSSAPSTTKNHNLSPKDRIKMINFFGKNICSSIVSQGNKEKIIQSVHKCVTCCSQGGVSSPTKSYIICVNCKKLCHQDHETEHLGFRITFCNCEKICKSERGCLCKIE